MTAMATTQQTEGPAAKKMKLEHDNVNGTAASPSTPVATTPTSAAATPAYSTAPQWSANIDPALQQQPPPQPTPVQHPIIPYQHYQYGATHYPQATYAHAHYTQYQTAQPPATAPATPAPLTRQNTQTNTVDTTDVSRLNDALGSAGVDLRAEEETLQRSQEHHTTYRAQEDRSRKQPSFDTRILGATMRDIGSRHKVVRVQEDSVNYVALALRTRLQGIVKAMIGAAEHRVQAQYDRPPSLYDDGTPMWDVAVRRDTRKQLDALEKAEREEEIRIRRERKELENAAATQAAAASQAGGTPSTDGVGASGSTEDVNMEGATPPKKAKKKRDGPGVMARNMSEVVQKRLSNAVATQAAGLGRGKYAWMNAGGVAPTPKKFKKETSATPAAGGTSGGKMNSTEAGTPGQTSNGGTWAKPYAPPSAKASSSPAPGEEEKTTVTIRDAMFVVERERGHGAGRGSARGWV